MRLELEESGKPFLDKSCALQVVASLELIVSWWTVSFGGGAFHKFNGYSTSPLLGI
jgi:hypothetical protein